MKNIAIGLIAGIIFALLVILLTTIVQYILTVYVNTNKHSSFTVSLHYGILPIIISILIALEVYLITI